MLIKTDYDYNLLIFTSLGHPEQTEYYGDQQQWGQTSEGGV